ncbi:MAG: hypothetical protein DRP11_05555 [Candidatus Aenigmatarchaeota archaeon]|nr:MAG: hypothetical protein DRP11_05555 [Candidatus Aenigmarchaeota archaeon]
MNLSLLFFYKNEALERRNLLRITFRIGFISLMIYLNAMFLFFVLYFENPLMLVVLLFWSLPLMLFWMPVTHYLLFQGLDNKKPIWFLELCIPFFGFFLALGHYLWVRSEEVSAEEYALKRYQTALFGKVKRATRTKRKKRHA